MFRSCDILSAIQVFIASPLDANNVTRRKERKKEQQKRVAGMIERKIRNSTLWIEVIKSGFTIWLELETENVNSFQWCCRYIRKTRSWAAWRSDRFCLVTLVLFHFCYYFFFSLSFSLQLSGWIFLKFFFLSTSFSSSSSSFYSFFFFFFFFFFFCFFCFFFSFLFWKRGNQSNNAGGDNLSDDVCLTWEACRAPQPP